MPESQVLARVVTALEAHLRVSAASITPESFLHDLPGFDSLAVVRILEHLEHELAVEMDPTLIVPDTFESPLSLARALVRSGTAVR